MDVQPTKLLQLRDAILSTWSKSFQSHLVDSMPFLKAKGDARTSVVYK